MAWAPWTSKLKQDTEKTWKSLFLAFSLGQNTQRGAGIKRLCFYFYILCVVLPCSLWLPWTSNSPFWPPKFRAALCRTRDWTQDRACMPGKHFTSWATPPASKGFSKTERELDMVVHAWREFWRGRGRRIAKLNKTWTEGLAERVEEDSETQRTKIKITGKRKRSKDRFREPNIQTEAFRNTTHRTKYFLGWWAQVCKLQCAPGRAMRL